jgi:hypothetical protein
MNEMNAETIDGRIMFYQVHYQRLIENKDKLDSRFFYSEKDALEQLIKRLNDDKNKFTESQNK